MTFVETAMAVVLALLVIAGFGIALWKYPWRSPKISPYGWVLALVLTPLIVLGLLQVWFGMPAGSCVERPLNYLPFLAILLSLLLCVGAPLAAKNARVFSFGLALGFLPLTTVWAIITVMSLAGCWI